MIRDRIIDILESCGNYPSGDNSLPYSSELISDNEVKLVRDEERSKHVMNPQGFTDLLTLGIILETIKISCYQHGLQMSIDMDIENFEAKLSFVETEYEPLSVETALYNSLPSRTTNRFKLDKTAISTEHIQQIVYSTLSCKNIKAEVFTNISKKLAKCIAQGETLIWRWPIAFKHVANEINFTDEEVKTNLRGLNIKGLGLKEIEIPMFKFIKKNLFLVDFLTKLGWHINGFLLGRKLVNNCGGFIVFSVEDFSKDTVIEAGRAIIRSWLQCDALEIQVQPLSSSVLPFCALEAGLAFEEPMPSKVINEHIAYYNKIKNDFGIDSGMPVFLMRIGYGKRLQDNQLSLKSSFLKL